MKVEINGLAIENGTGKVELTLEEARVLFAKLKEMFGEGKLLDPNAPGTPPAVTPWPAFPVWPPGTPCVPCPSYPPVVVPDGERTPPGTRFPPYPEFPIVTCQGRSVIDVPVGRLDP